mmetsp:Transcript_12780/g.33375  ORF Transcript_12780/g.33375 Transcript_12780/m.33375 type:complete len:294 (+) Transcript_12780:46-927(+)
MALLALLVLASSGSSCPDHALYTLTPATVFTQDAPTTVTIAGAGLADGDIVELDVGNTVTATVISASSAIFDVPASLLSSAGAIRVAVRHLSGVLSNALELRVASLSSVTPASVPITGRSSLTLHGANFASNAELVLKLSIGEQEVLVPGLTFDDAGTLIADELPLFPVPTHVLLDEIPRNETRLEAVDVRLSLDGGAFFSPALRNALQFQIRSPLRVFYIYVDASRLLGWTYWWNLNRLDADARYSTLAMCSQTPSRTSQRTWRRRARSALRRVRLITTSSSAHRLGTRTAC